MRVETRDFDTENEGFGVRRFEDLRGVWCPAGDENVNTMSW